MKKIFRIVLIFSCVVSLLQVNTNEIHAIDDGNRYLIIQDYDTTTSTPSILLYNFPQEHIDLGDDINDYGTDVVTDTIVPNPSYKGKLDIVFDPANEQYVLTVNGDVRLTVFVDEDWIGVKKLFYNTTDNSLRISQVCYAGIYSNIKLKIKGSGNLYFDFKQKNVLSSSYPLVADANMATGIYIKNSLEIVGDSESNPLNIVFTDLTAQSDKAVAGNYCSYTMGIHISTPSYACDQNIKITNANITFNTNTGIMCQNGEVVSLKNSKINYNHLSIPNSTLEAFCKSYFGAPAAIYDMKLEKDFVMENSTINVYNNNNEANASAIWADIPATSVGASVKIKNSSISVEGVPGRNDVTNFDIAYDGGPNNGLSSIYDDVFLYNRFDGAISAPCINIVDSTIKTIKTEYGIRCVDGDLSISNSSIDLNTEYGGIYIDNGALEINNTKEKDFRITVDEPIDMYYSYPVMYNYDTTIAPNITLPSNGHARFSTTDITGLGDYDGALNDQYHLATFEYDPITPPPTPTPTPEPVVELYQIPNTCVR